MSMKRKEKMGCVLIESRLKKTWWANRVGGGFKGSKYASNPNLQRSNQCITSKFDQIPGAIIKSITVLSFHFIYSFSKSCITHFRLTLSIWWARGIRLYVHVQSLSSWGRNGVISLQQSNRAVSQTIRRPLCSMVGWWRLSRTHVSHSTLNETLRGSQSNVQTSESRSWTERRSGLVFTCWFTRSFERTSPDMSGNMRLSTLFPWGGLLRSWERSSLSFRSSTNHSKTVLDCVRLRKQ